MAKPSDLGSDEWGFDSLVAHAVRANGGDEDVRHRLDLTAGEEQAICPGFQATSALDFLLLASII